MSAPHRLDYATPPPRPPRQWSQWSIRAMCICVPFVFGILGWFVGYALGPNPTYGTRGLLQVSANGDTSPPQTLADAQKAYIAAATNPAFIASIAKQTGVPAESIAAHLQVSPIPSSHMIDIWYSAQSPNEAFNVVSAIVAAYPAQVVPAQVIVLSRPIQANILGKSGLPGLFGTVVGCLTGIYAGRFVTLAIRRRALNY